MFGNTLLEGVFIRLTLHLEYDEVRFMTTVIKCLLLNNDILNAIMTLSLL